MATAHVEELRGDMSRSVEVLTGGSMVGVFGSLGAVVLAILALAGVLQDYFAAIATICIGGALLMEGGALATKYSKIVRRATGGSDTADMAGGVTSELMAGIAGIVLGILALLNVASFTLAAVALLVFGAALLLGSSTASRINTFAVRVGVGSDVEQRLGEEMLRASAGAQVLMALGGLTLGVLALIGLNQATLVLVGLLGVSASLLLTSSSVAGRLMETMEH